MNRRTRVLFILIILCLLIYSVLKSHEGDEILFTRKELTTFSQVEKPILNQVKNNPSIKQIFSFKRCLMFRGSIFYVNESITEEIFSSFIDENSKIIEDQIRKDHPDVEQKTDSVQRYSCFEAVNSPRVSETYGKILYKTFLPAYFPNISFVTNNLKMLYAHSPQKLANPFRKYKAKIAYLLMVHGDDDEENVSRIFNIIKAATDQHAFTLVHVDQTSDELFSKLVLKTEEMKNVLVTPKRTNVQWGLSSMVYSEIDAFFQLLDLAEWDFVLNFSSHDYPIRSSSYIHNNLTKDHIYIKYWEDRETYDRVNNVIFYQKNMNAWKYVSSRKQFPFKDMNITKHHQWVVFPRSYIEYLRTEDDQAHDLLMYMEHSKIPDEWFFSTSISRKDHPFSKKMINDHKRFIPKFKSKHPPFLTDGSIHELTEMLKFGDFFFARKIDNIKQKKLTKWMDSIRMSVEN